jgi:hypothetical protein
MFRFSVDHKSKFALIFHYQQDKQQPGIVVDIFALEKGCFLSTKVHPENRLDRHRSVMVNQNNRLVVVANSPTAPSNKFLILAEGVE